MVSFKGAHYPKDVILFAVFFYVRYGSKENSNQGDGLHGYNVATNAAIFPGRLMRH